MDASFGIASDGAVPKAVTTNGTTGNNDTSLFAGRVPILLVSATTPQEPKTLAISVKVLSVTDSHGRDKVLPLLLLYAWPRLLTHSVSRLNKVPSSAVNRRARPLLSLPAQRSGRGLSGPPN